ncbi:MAG: hydrolase [Syntrophaceticus sp.]
MIEHCHCQKINPEDWHEKEHFWETPRFFYRVTTRMAFHQPLSYHEDIAMAMAKANSKGYIIKENAMVLLKSGLFRGELLVEIQPPKSKELYKKDTACLQLQGRFYSRVAQAPLMRLGKDIDKLTRDLKKREEQVQDLYLCLITCPSCVREKGNQTVIIAHLA